MFPVLFSFGSIVIYTAHVFYILAWCVFSFVFWRTLRALGMLEERIFDLTFYSTIVCLIAARLGFVFLYPQAFSPSILLIGAFWVLPGMWLYSGLLGVLGTIFILSKRGHVRFAHVIDSFSLAILWAIIFVLLGLFFGGGELGKITSLPIGLKVSGVLRHPIQLYELSGVLVVGTIATALYRNVVQGKWQPGLFGAVTLSLLSAVLFVLEFWKVGPLYLYGITLNQWILIAVFAESFGVVLTKGRILEKVKSKIGGIHGRRNNKSTEIATAGGTETSDTADRRAEESGSISGSGTRE